MSYDGVLNVPAPLPTGYWTQPAAQMRGGFRFLTIVSTSDGAVSFSNVSCGLNFMPHVESLRDYSGYFYAADPKYVDQNFLTKIWYAGAYTVQIDTIPYDTGRDPNHPSPGWANNYPIGNTGAVLVDGAKRDRSVWPGDLGISLPTQFVSTNDLVTTRNALDTLYAMQSASGALPYSGPPISAAAGSDTYHAWTLVGTYTYVLYSGDFAWLQHVWSNYTRGVEYLAEKVDETGLLNVTGVLDWGRIGQGGNNAEANALYYKVLTSGADLASWLNDTDLADAYATNASALKPIFNDALWLADRGMYRDNLTTTFCAQDSNSLAVVFNLTENATQAASISEGLTANWGVYGATAPELPDTIAPFIGGFELQAHFIAGRGARALDLLHREWGYMLYTPLSVQSTLLEGYTTNGSLYFRSADGYDYDASYTSHAHGWSTGPTSVLSFYVLGLQITGPQGQTWAVAPHTAGLPYAEGGYETPLGWFGVRWSLGEGWWNATVSPPLDVNARDWLGRTVLHLAAAAQDAAAPEYVRMLLAYPDIQINLTDAESHWTALHRALYHGNLSTAIILLQRPDIDITLRDLEGYTAFDLYNSTLEGTKPASDDTGSADLLTWGANRNAALGLGNGDDRVYPEQVVVRPPEGSAVSEKENIDARFAPIHVQQVVMSKLHTAVVTSEPRANLRVCGFGSGGRLGPGQHTQYSLIPLAQFNGTVESVALGQDHTLLVTKSGEVHSWGLNRFSQLGYVVEVADSIRARGEEPIQTTARKVVGPLKNKVVLGVAACKTASACWTAGEVYTWGTNNGQLGYDKSAHPVQVLPRVVTKVSQPVISVSITDNAMACLLSTQDVICLWNDGHFKVNFPAQSFPSEIAAYRPPHSISNASIEKITSSEGTFAALSSNGELFTFTVPAGAESGAGGSKSRAAIVPQRVWALRKKFTAVKDVALGADGSIIICTESGHVFVRTRTAKPGHGAAGGAAVKTHKFTQMPYLQRVVCVCANVTGAYGALRVDYVPPPVKVVGRLVAQDLAEVQPWLRFDALVQETVKGVASPTEVVGSGAMALLNEDMEEEIIDDEHEDFAIQKDIRDIRTLLTLLEAIKAAHASESARSPFEGKRLPHGADILIQVHSYEVPAHRVMLAARSPALARSSRRGRPDAHPRLAISACQPLSVLLLLTYVYSDDVPALWDPRVGLALSGAIPALGVRLAQVKQELQALARVLELPSLSASLEAPVKRVPKPMMVADLTRLFTSSQIQPQTQGPRGARDPLAPDVVLRLADKDVRTHALVLRARSPFFAAFFDEEEWTRTRWTPEGTVVVDLRHLRWREMELVCRWMCCGGDAEMFDVIEHVKSVDDLLDFMFNVMSAANELHLDRLMFLCSEVILKRVNVLNVCAVLSDASFYHALPLIASLHAYMAANMETILESRMLDDLPLSLIKQLSVFVREQQAHNSRRLRRAAPVVRPVLAPPPSAQSFPADDEVFMMDDAGPSTPSQPAAPLPEAAAGWRAISSAPRVDMRTIMAETESSTSVRRTPVPGPIARKPSSEMPTPFRGTPPKAANFPVLPRAPVGLAMEDAAAPGHADEATEQSSASRPTTTAPGTQPPTPTKKPAASVGMGPTITPAKKPAPAKHSPGSIRRVSSGSVWTLPPVQPVVQSSTTTGMSFVAIQELQREQDRGPDKDKRSLLQIQEEEQARQAEEDFLRWWTAEEARLKAEEQGVPQGSQRPQKSRKPKPSKPKAPKAEAASGPSAAPAFSSAPKQDREAQGQAKKPRKTRPAKGSTAPKSTDQ
ncbi:hypothetical protein EVJ58_g6418 [Rhodofomes roseus]|uniref:BTB domain-containing protein n=1 Tax=Rhodofomes roseus TaxID=34475 RepID=A0A4Y9Y9N3_9APHY|nr:hypothetical protein EVJ58_g6418 [Rhodofomes roseus]